MKTIITFLFSAFIVTYTMAQAPTGVFAKASADPVIDGVVDEVWAEATVYNIDLPFQTEVPSLGASGETTWQGVWTEDGVYILLKVTDDAFFPAYMATPPSTSNWEYDKPELYLDVNYVLKDGIGGGGGKGHYQVAPGFTDGKNDGTPITTIDGVVGVVYAFMVSGPNYIAEYFIPFAKLLDNEGNILDKINAIGFDVTIIDRDPDDTARKRAVWANIGTINESYANMDDAGLVTFAGAEPGITIDAITLNNGGTITTDNGTLQMVATIVPANATSPIKWSVINGTGQATINDTGLVKAIKDGTVSVKVKAADLMGVEAMVDVVISGQSPTRSEVSLVKDGFFDDPTRAAWSGGTVVNGVLVCDPPAAGANPWDWTTTQIVAVSMADKDVPYIFTFKAWADAIRTFNVDFEDSNNGFSRYGISSDPEALPDGTSDWTFEVTTEPTVYVFHVTFTNMKENARQSLQFMLGKADEQVYLDSVMLLKESDYNLYTSSKKSLSANSLNVYPNPVGSANQLNVTLTASNVKIAIYNAIGQKMMEKVSTGNLAKFDVSSLRKGLYFVRLSDGTTQKFVK